MPHTPWSDVLDHGYPDLRTLDDDGWAPAFRQAMTQHLSGVDQLAALEEPPTVENVLHRLSRAGQPLRQVQQAFGVLIASDATAARQAVRHELAAELAAHRDAVTVHQGLLARLRALQSAVSSGAAPATEEQRWYLHVTLQAAEQAGADLPGDALASVQRINQQLAVHEAVYSDLQTTEAAASAVWCGEPEQLAGLSEQRIAAAADAAREAGHDSGYLLTLGLPVQQPVLEQLQDPATRQAVFTASVSRGNMPGHDGRTTRTVGAQIAVLRAERAALLGYSSHLEATLPGRSAPSKEAIFALMRQIADGASAGARQECQQIAEFLHGHPQATAETTDQSLPPEDLQWGLAQVREARAARSGQSDSSQGGTTDPVTLDEALEKMFDAAEAVYGVTVRPRHDLPGYMPGARSYEVFDTAKAAPDSSRGLFLLDAFSRPSKSGGAWMNSFCVASELEKSSPVVTNNLNLTATDNPADQILSPGELKTLFHEFGHALHGLLAEAEFPELSGTAVPRDVVEFPSQVNELFQDLGAQATTPEETAGTPAWGTGISTAEHVAAVALDLAWHSLSVTEARQAAEDPAGFEHQVLVEWGLDLPAVPPRYHGGFFKHVFAGSGYAAGYYSYLWAQVLAADTAAWFREVLDDPQTLAERGAHFRRELLSRGNTRDPMESYRAVLGRDPQPEALMKKLGLTGA